MNKTVQGTATQTLVVECLRRGRTLKCSRTAATDSEDHCNVQSRQVPAYHKNTSEPYWVLALQGKGQCGSSVNPGWIQGGSNTDPLWYAGVGLTDPLIGLHTTLAGGVGAPPLSLTYTLPPRPRPSPCMHSLFANLSAPNLMTCWARFG